MQNHYEITSKNQFWNRNVQHWTRTSQWLAKSGAEGTRKERGLTLHTCPSRPGPAGPEPKETYTYYAVKYFFI